MAYKDRKSRKAFVETWKGRGYEKGETQQFWLSLLTNVLGYEHNDTVLFEHRTSTGGYIDVWIRQSDVMIEQKGIEVDLDKEEIRQGALKTPLQQVQDYASSLPITEQPKYLITCNFETFRVYDRTRYGDAELKDNKFEFTLSDLIEHPEYLSCIIDPNNSRLRKEQEVSEQAGQLIGNLYDMLLKQYFDPDSEETQHSLNVLCVRIVFCLFCEDAGLFGEPDAFCNYLSKVDPADIRIKLQHLFDNLDIPREDRDKYDTDIKVFPYVNGGLFREKVEIPPFTQEIKDFLIEKMAIPVNWSNISPTIFGGIFESTLNPETRRKGGMHYTSPENIHKVIDPLFLNDLKAEFETIRTDEELSVIKKRNRYRKFHEKLCSLVFFDPACGSGNFLTETYICLRRLEYAVLKEYKSKQVSLFDSSVEGEVELRVKLDQFYGIEINDFAVAVAETALWISRLKANQEYFLLLDLDEKDFPLTDRANIICENALRFDWNDLVEPLRVSYIMGNPPFVGYYLQDEQQKKDMLLVWVDENGKPYKNAGKIDYVSSWFFIAAKYIQNTDIRCSFVATNSITQGEQVASVWKPLFERFGIHIDFAWRTFKWGSESNDAASVHCVIIGFSNALNSKKRVVYLDNQTTIEATSINAYLIDGENCFIDSRRKPLCDVPEMILGNIPRDGGFLSNFSRDEYLQIVNNYPQAIKLFRRIYGSVELIHNLERYCLWLIDVPQSEYIEIPPISEALVGVREFRNKSSRIPTKKLADVPMRFAEVRQVNSNYLAFPEVSSQNREYIPIAYLSPTIVCTNKLFMLPQATLLHFGVLTSSVHMSWTRAIAGRLKSDFNYSNVVVYNNFPWPTPTDEQKALIEQTARGILDIRSKHPDKCLADLYDSDKMPADLKAAHEANNKAVMDAYGFPYEMTEPEIVAELMKMYQELTAQK